MELLLILITCGVTAVIIARVLLGRMAELFCYVLILGVLTAIVVGVELGGQIKNANVADINKADPQELALLRLMPPDMQAVVARRVAEDPVQEGALTRAINNTVDERWRRDERRFANFVQHPSFAVEAIEDYVKQHKWNVPAKLMESAVISPVRTLHAFRSGYVEHPLQVWASIAANIVAFTFLIRFSLIVFNSEKDGGKVEN